MERINPSGRPVSKTIYVSGIYEEDKTAGGAVTQTRTYYPVGGAMRVDSTLYYVLKDQLGSASAVTDTTINAAIVGEDRFYPLGETRFTTGTMLTDKLFTRQRQISLTGSSIYYYDARFYSSYIGRFLSADTVVSSYANPQSLNRYSYVLNNPLSYRDPTGHIECEEVANGVCNPYTQSEQISDLKLIIKDQFSWNVQGKWRLKELNDIYQTGVDIQHYVDQLTIGGGSVWMAQYMSGVTIAHAGNGTLAGLIGEGNRNSSWPWNEIYLNKGWSNKDLAHELAEIWDLKSSQFITTGGYYGGVADQLNKAFGGDIMSHPFACRFCNMPGKQASPHNPQNYLWNRGAYANSSTEDYFSESFSHMVYPNQVGDSTGMPAGVQDWLDWQIIIQTSTLEVPFGAGD